MSGNISPKTRNKKSRILCVIPSLPKDLNIQCVPSVLAQTYPIEMLVILPKEVKGGTLPERVSFALNQGLSNIRLENFDYLLRVDGDTVLPADFLEESLKDAPDLYGDWGYAMLIKIRPFLELMNGKFHPESDDSYIIHKFIAENRKVVSGQLELVKTRKRPHGMNDLLACGKIYYKLGYEPFHVLSFFGNRRRKDMLLVVIGYFNALIRRERKFDMASYIWRHQTRKLALRTLI